MGLAGIASILRNVKTIHGLLRESDENIKRIRNKLGANTKLEKHTSLVLDNITAKIKTILEKLKMDMYGFPTYTTDITVIAPAGEILNEYVLYQLNEVEKLLNDTDDIALHEAIDKLDIILIRLDEIEKNLTRT